MSELSHTIRANDRTITEVLDNKKYTVDYFQREYKWEEKHIEELVFDLTSAFLNEYKPENKREQVELYNSYYLGPFVVSEKGGQRSIIDGQQRLTSLTLLLIYLNNLQKELDFSEVRGTEGIKEASVELNGVNIKVAVVNGIKNARIICEKIISC